EARWRTLSRIGCVVISLAALGWVFHRIDLSQLGEVLARARLLWIGAAFGVFGLGFLLAAGRWHIVLRLSQCQVHGSATVRTVLIGHLFNTILLGPSGGDIAKAAFYARLYGFATSTILATCALDRFLGGVGFFVFAGSAPGVAAYSGHWSSRA